MPDFKGKKRTIAYRKGRAKSSVFQMKGNPMQRNFGVGSPLHDETEEITGTTLPEVTVTGNKGYGDDVTDEYSKIGSKSTRDAIKRGTRVYRGKSGQLTLVKSGKLTP
mgnify:CR=1 FL=1